MRSARKQLGIRSFLASLITVMLVVTALATFGEPSSSEETTPAPLVLPTPTALGYKYVKLECAGVTNDAGKLQFDSDASGTANVTVDWYSKLRLEDEWTPVRRVVNPTDLPGLNFTAGETSIVTVENCGSISDRLVVEFFQGINWESINTTTGVATPVSFTTPNLTELSSVSSGLYLGFATQSWKLSPPAADAGYYRVTWGSYNSAASDGQYSRTPFRVLGQTGHYGGGKDILDKTIPAQVIISLHQRADVDFRVGICNETCPDVDFGLSSTPTESPTPITSPEPEEQNPPSSDSGLTSPAVMPVILNPSDGSGEVGTSTKGEPGAIHTLTGTNLDTVEEVKVGDDPAKITLKTATKLGFRIPNNLSAGLHDLSLYGSFGSMTQAKFLSVSKKRIVRISAGFAGDSPVLTAPIKREIAKFLKRLPGHVRIVCVGSTRNNVRTQFDVRLATTRANRACAYAASVTKGLDTKIRIKPSQGLEIRKRNVKLILTNY